MCEDLLFGGEYVKQYSSLNAIEQNLASESIKARTNAYCPYSSLEVGAALLCEDDTIFTGCNVENSSYGLCICAERTAIVKAVSEGHRKFKMIAVSSLLNNNFVTPCGSCRQFISEFSDSKCDIEVLIVLPDRSKVIKTTISKLIPFSFKFEDPPKNS